ncbi:MAG: flagellar hook capping FlgD N-terminal domain-containing protein [Candidatus Baltobacteraceae bacterium]
MPSALAGSSNTPPISSLVQAPTTGTQVPSTNNSALGSGAFLQLLITEMQNQDPTAPQDPTQSVTQLAQFSALQAQTTLNSSFQNFQSNFGVLQSASLIGKQVTVSTPNGSGNTSTQTGTVGTISVQNGAPFFTLNDSTGKPYTDGNGAPLLYSTTEIVGIGT